MDFSDALSTMRQGGRVRRRLWSQIWPAHLWLEIVANWDLLASDWEAE
jgi:hypothetical protein